MTLLYSQELIDRRAGTGLIPFDKEEFPADFPYARWNQQTTRYLKYWDHWTGKVWEETIPNKKDEFGNPVLRYPLRINYLKTIAVKHAAAVCGQVTDTSSSIIEPRIFPRKPRGATDITDADRNRAKKVEEFLHDVWEENMGRSMQQEAILTSQFLGGAVLKASWDPEDDELENHIRVEIVLPDFFLPVWDTGRPDNLLECYVVWRMPTREAELTYDYKPGDGSSGPLYIEHWTKKTISISLGGKPVTVTMDGESITYDKAPNPYGVVPFVYIPRKRAGTYYGLSLVDDVEGKAIEMNNRLADIGDIIQDTAQRDIYLSNIPSGQNIKVVDMGHGRVGLNLGTSGPNMPEPKAFVIDPPKLPDGVRELLPHVQAQIYQDSGVPPIAFGTDEGSQRSGLTLQVRFWPLTTEAQSQRNHWTDGLTRLNRIIAKIAIVKDLGLTEEDIKGIYWRQDWADMLPRDREQALNEGVLLSSQHAIAPDELSAKLDWTDDPQVSYEKGKKHYEWQMATEAEAQMKVQADKSAQVVQPKASAGVTK